jgi:maleylpyruvate isomerase
MVELVDEGIPHQLLAAVEVAQHKLDCAVTRMDPTLLCNPSLVPGWSRGHIVAHLAANAESHFRRTKAAADGYMVDQYSGGGSGRDLEIETRSRHSAESLIQGVLLSGAALTEQWQSVHPGAWSARVKQLNGPDLELRDLPRRRWQEVAVHLVDLDIGETSADWPDDFVAPFLPRLRKSLLRRLPNGVRRPTAQLDERTELAWLYGRANPEGSPALLAWG